MTATVTGVLNVCRSQIGYREGANNDNKYGRWYGWNNVPYCAIGLSWAAAVAGASDIMHGRFAYCPTWTKAFKTAGQWQPWDATPRPGDIAFFDWSGLHQLADHVGIVESLDSSVLVTIEFNTTNAAIGNPSDGQGVWRRRRWASAVVGYGRPAYAAQTAPLPAPRRHTRPLIVDGVWGPQTTSHLQMWLHAPISAVLDTTTRKALQARLGVTVDGVWGPITHRALQHLLGVSMDGDWGPVTVTALQRLLNRVVL